MEWIGDNRDGSSRLLGRSDKIARQMGDIDDVDWVGIVWGNCVESLEVRDCSVGRGTLIAIVESS